MISALGESLGSHLGALARIAGETPGNPSGILDAEEHVEKLAAPAPGQAAALSHGPLVETNLALYRASDNFVYTLGLDYFEDPDGGFENVRIPAGTMLRAEYVYHTEPPIGHGGGVYLAAASSVPVDSPVAGEAPAQGTAPDTSGRYASTLKLGRV